MQHAEIVAARTENIWDDSLIAAARRPLPVLIWLAGISFALHLIHRQTGEQLLEYVTPARSIGVVICSAWFLFKLIRELANNVIAASAQSGEEVDRSTVDALSKVSRIVVVVVTALAVMQTLGFSVSGLLAFGGMGGIAVGFAAKDLLANFFGGLMIHLDRPFNVGEMVRSPDKQIEGTVEHIGWRQTRIRSTNMTLIYVPNALFTANVVENPSRMSHRRIRETIGLRYDDLSKISAIIEDVKTMLKTIPISTTARKRLLLSINSPIPRSTSYCRLTAKPPSWRHSMRSNRKYCSRYRTSSPNMVPKWHSPPARLYLNQPPA